MSQATLSLYQELAFGRDCESSKDAPLKFNSHLRQTCACTSHRPALWFARNCFAPLPALCRERPHSEDQLPPTAGFARVEQQPVPVAVAGLSCQASSNRGPVAGGLGRKIAISEKYSLVCRSPTAELLKRRPPGHQKSEGYQAIARLMRACVKIGDPKKNDCPLASLKQKKTQVDTEPRGSLLLQPATSCEVSSHVEAFRLVAATVKGRHVTSRSEFLLSYPL